MFLWQAFFEKYDFRLIHSIANKLRDTVPLKYVSRQTNVSSSTVSRILDTISYSCPSLKDSYAIDEFKGHADTGKYHFIRQVTWAIESVRKRLQKTMPSSLRKYYKRSHKLILTRYNKLKGENKSACDLMLLYNDDLRKKALTTK